MTALLGFLKVAGWMMTVPAFALVTGCNNGEKLTESLCKDLGTDDCASWKALGGPDQVIPGGRKVNRACGALLDNERAYRGTLLGARATVIADQLQKAAQANDQAKVKELTAKQSQITAEIKADLAKLRNQ